MQTIKRGSYLVWLLFLVSWLLPSLASAHEVYVLTPAETAAGLSTPPFNMLQVALANENQFLFWGFVVFIVVTTIFCFSVFRGVERRLDPFLFRIKRYAPLVCRVTVGLGLLAGTYYQASFGPELPYATAYGALAPIVTFITVAIALLFVAGVWVRAAAAVALLLFAYGIVLHGAYMLTYANYFGEFLVLLLIGVNKKRATGMWKKIRAAVEPYEFAIIRVSFGISLFFAAFYAKILHNQLAVQVASLPLAGHQYGVAHYLGFEPHFLVLGAAIIETLIAAFFIFGIEIRWTSIFLEFWLSLSLLYFGETVWPHLILIGIPIALFMHGYDRTSLEGRFFKKHRLEPAL